MLDIHIRAEETTPEYVNKWSKKLGNTRKPSTSLTLDETFVLYRCQIKCIKADKEIEGLFPPRLDFKVSKQILFCRIRITAWGKNIAYRE